MEYDSTPYAGMMKKQNGGKIFHICNGAKCHFWYILELQKLLILSHHSLYTCTYSTYVCIQSSVSQFKALTTTYYGII